ncbi:MAG: response regulator [Opitutales bacterium]
MRFSRRQGDRVRANGRGLRSDGRRVALLLIWGLSRCILNGEAGLPMTEQFGAEAFSSEWENFVVHQDAQGQIWVGNQAVVRFDGQHWTQHDPGGATNVRGIDSGPGGRIWIGALDEMGYFAATPEGDYRYTSLLDHLEDGDLPIEPIWAVHHHADLGQTLFFGNQTVYRWDGTAFSLTRFEAASRISPVRSGNISFLSVAGDGLYRFLGDRWDRRFAAEALPGNVIVGIRMDREDGITMIGTLRNGLYLRDSSAWRRFSTEGDDTLVDALLMAVEPLPGGRLALPTFKAGVLVIEADGRLSYQLKGGQGLTDDRANNTLLDRDQGLWVAGQNGLTRVALDLNAYRLDERLGLAETPVLAAARYDNNLHVAAGNNIYRLDRAADSLVPRFRQVPGLSRPAFDLATPRGGPLLIGSQAGLLAWDGGRLTTIDGDAGQVFTVYPSKTYDDLLFTGSNTGARHYLREASGWVPGGVLEDIPGPISSFVELADGQLLLTGVNNGVYRVGIHPSGTGYRFVTTRLSGEGSLPNRRNPPQFAKINQRLLVLDEAGLFEIHDPHNPGRRERILSPGINAQNSVLGSAPGGHEAFVYHLAEDRQRARLLWLRGALPDDPIEVGTLRTLPGSFGGKVWSLVAEEDTLWLNASTGLIRTTVEPPAEPEQPEPPLLRRLAHRDPDAPGQRASLPLTGEALEQLPFAFNDLRFAFAAPQFHLGGHVEFQTRLRGFESDWSNWNRQTYRDFTNLREGDYVFEVRQRDLAGQLSPPAELRFSIAPPWYRTWGAYTGYAFVAVIGLLALGHWRTRRLRKINAILEESVRSRTLELIKANENLNRASKAKSAFVARMSHDIRNPLNGIIGTSQLLLKRAEHPELRPSLERILACGQYLKGHIDDVLNFSKIESGKVVPNPEPVALESVLTTLESLFAYQVEAKGLYLKIDYKGAEAPVLVDRQILLDVLANLVSNGIKFTETGGIRVHCETRGGSRPGRLTARFSIEDTGLGIPKEERARIFEPYAQGSSGRRLMPGGGSGLGLSIARALTLSLGGSLKVDSQPGQGTCFSFELTLSETDSSPVQAEEGGQVSEPAGGVALPLASSEPLDLHVLVIEDDVYNRQVIAEMLEACGCTSQVAGDGENGLRVFRQDRFDAVLLDFSLPDGEGPEFARRIKTLRSVPIFAVTAYATEQSRKACLDAGMDGFISKPVDPDHLRGVLSGLTKAFGRSTQSMSETAIPTSESDAAAPAADDPPLRTDYLFYRKDDPTARLEAVRTLRRDIRNGWAQARAALTGEDPKAAARAVHHIAGKCDLVGFSNVSNILRPIEDRLRSGQFPEREAWVETDGEILRLSRALEKLEQGLKADSPAV